MEILMEAAQAEYAIRMALGATLVGGAAVAMAIVWAVCLLYKNDGGKLE